MTISVLVVDDQPLVRHAVRDILVDGGLVVVGEASNGRDAVRAAAETAPDVVLMDIRMPELDGIAATALICADAPASADAHASNRPRVLILTTFEEDENVVAALRAGASGFIGKGAEPEEIVRAVRTVHRGDALLSSSATRSLIERSLRPGAVPPSERWEAVLAPLTPREREALQLCRRRADQPRHRRPSHDLAPHREDPRESDHGEGRRARPGAAGDPRLRVRGGDTRPLTPGLRGFATLGA